MHLRVISVSFFLSPSANADNQHLRGAADQCELLGNLPAINNAQMLQNIMNAVDNIGVRITAM